MSELKVWHKHCTHLLVLFIHSIQDLLECKQVCFPFIIFYRCVLSKATWQCIYFSIKYFWNLHFMFDVGITFKIIFFSSEFFGCSILSRIQYILMQDYESVLAVGINKTTLINLPDSLVVWPNFQTSRESKYWNIIILASVATLTNENCNKNKPNELDMSYENIYLVIVMNTQCNLRYCGHIKYTCVTKRYHNSHVWTTNDNYNNTCFWKVLQ